MTLADKESALASNDGVQNSDGYIRAGTIAFGVGAGLYTQNSGTSSETAGRAGVTAGAGGITLSRLDGGSQAPVEVVLNGVQQSTAGTFAGNDLVSHVSYDSTSFTPADGSTVNGCFFAGSDCTGSMPSEPQAPTAQIVPPVQDIISGVNDSVASPSTGGGRSNVGLKATRLVSSAKLAAIAGTPLIDESLVGADNVDLWGGYRQDAVYDRGK